ncbi:MAG: hypothetical protein QOK40_2589 [Miltoncostaeaceae bacterium]|nr:hypothetical protein [Miltoncostaeaceae bacterium]
MFGLPDAVRACLFDLDGVLTRTAVVHAAAWRTMFDEYLRGQSRCTGEPFVSFGQSDYDRYVDGMPRNAGVRSFLVSWGIALSEGGVHDPPGAETVTGLGERKNDPVRRMIAEQGIEAYEGSVRYVRAVRAAGLRTAVVED